ncbi:hypothetical protein BGZ63DRAFT_465267 [Mariannaea sp. PMI_226]|nr:hypothetical protein BGZ63DRAFT_465267 [Mariannaea sp. PMI_226]
MFVDLLWGRNYKQKVKRKSYKRANLNCIASARRILQSSASAPRGSVAITHAYLKVGRYISQLVLSSQKARRTGSQFQKQRHRHGMAHSCIGAIDIGEKVSPVSELLAAQKKSLSSLELYSSLGKTEKHGDRDYTQFTSIFSVQQNNYLGHWHIPWPRADDFGAGPKKVPEAKAEFSEVYCSGR